MGLDQAHLRRGLETKRFRQVDEMPEEFLAELQQTLVSSTDSADIIYALRVATMCLFREAQGLDKVLGLDVASRIEVKMQEYLNLCG